jgi:hypothetical protein
MPRKSKTALPTYATVAELRAAIAASCREAAAIYRAEADAGLRNAGWWADRLDESAARNDRLAGEIA